MFEDPWSNGPKKCPNRREEEADDCQGQRDMKEMASRAIGFLPGSRFGVEEVTERYYGVEKKLPGQLCDSCCLKHWRDFNKKYQEGKDFSGEGSADRTEGRSPLPSHLSG